MMTLTTFGLSEWVILHDLQPNSKYQDIQISLFPNLQDYAGKTVQWGSFAWKIPSDGIRLLKKATMLHVRDDWYETPSFVTGNYLDINYPSRLRASASQYLSWGGRLSPPLMVKPGLLEQGIYIDLQSAYYNIVRRWGWDCDYFPGKWLTPGKPINDFPCPSNKLARNMLVSFALPSHSHQWDGYKLISRSTYNSHLNLGLWTLVQHVLHSIAKMASLCGGIYIHTDGYVIPLENAQTLINYIEDFGLDYRIKGEGLTFVGGFANYYVGKKRTKHIKPQFSKPSSNILDLDKNIEMNIKKAITTSYFEQD